MHEVRLRHPQATGIALLNNHGISALSGTCAGAFGLAAVLRWVVIILYARGIQVYTSDGRSIRRRLGHVAARAWNPRIPAVFTEAVGSVVERM